MKRNTEVVKSQSAGCLLRIYNSLFLRGKLSPRVCSNCDLRFFKKQEEQIYWSLYLIMKSYENKEWTILKQKSHLNLKST